MSITAKEVLQTLPKLYLSSADKGTSFSITFLLTGATPEVYSISIEKGSCSFIEGRVAHPTVQVITKPETWLAIASGEIKPMSAIMMGKLNIKGNYMLLMSLEQTFARVPEGYITTPGTSGIRDLWNRILFLQS